MFARHVTIFTAALSLAASLAFQASALEPENDQMEVAAGDPEQGHMLAENLCSGCHALEVEAASPNPDAPNFHALTLAYPPEYLAEGFAEGIVVGTDSHIGMPQFTLEPAQIDDLIAWLETVLPPASIPDAGPDTGSDTGEPAAGDTEAVDAESN